MTDQRIHDHLLLHQAHAITPVTPLPLEKPITQPIPEPVQPRTGSLPAADYSLENIACQVKIENQSAPTTTGSTFEPDLSRMFNGQSFPHSYQPSFPYQLHYPPTWNGQFAQQDNQQLMGPTYFPAPPVYNNDHHNTQNNAPAIEEEDLECPSCGVSVDRQTGKPDMKTGNLLCSNCFNRLAQSTSGTTQSHPGPIRGKREKKPKECPNCHSQNTTLWRKFKTADEIEKDIGKNSKIKDRTKVDRSRPDLEGVLGCNACTLYWKLHGKHRPMELVREGPPTQRKRKRKEKPEDSAKFMQGNMFGRFSQWNNSMYWNMQNSLQSYQIPPNGHFIQNFSNINMYPPLHNDYMSAGRMAITDGSIAGSSPCSSTGSSGDHPAM